MVQYKLYINGVWEDASSNALIDSTNPYTNEVWARIPRANEHDVDRACAAASDAFSVWSSMDSADRGKLLHRLADRLEAQSSFLGEKEVLDNGKLISEMAAQTAYIPQIYRYYAGLANDITGHAFNLDKPDHMAYSRYEPLGVVAAIVPWNSPLMVMSWKVAPALAAGNTVVIKPSEYTSVSAFEFAKIAHEVGFPPGVINVISGYGHEVGPALVSHEKVAKVAFTGGSATGARVASLAGEKIKGSVLELGGKSPNIVFSDAHIDAAVPGVISGIFAATGQTCIAGSRLLVEASIHDMFVEKLVAMAKEAKIGDPMKKTTQIGPISNPEQYKKVLSYIEIAKEEGATCVLGGHALNGPECGPCPWFVAPTIFTGVNNQMRIAQEEVFGPILSVIPFHSLEEAIEIANDSPFGLAAGVWTQDPEKALTVPNALKAGTVWVNTYRTISYRAPFGGYKLSGVGRENGPDALHEYLQEKTIYIGLKSSTRNPFVLG